MTTKLLFERASCDVRSGSEYPSEGNENERAEAVIAAIQEEGERIKRHEVEQLVRELDMGENTREGRHEAIEDLADAIVDRLLAAPVASLRTVAEDDPTAIDAALELFDPEFGPADGRKCANNGQKSGANDGD